jgi:hypothetical protein
MSREYGNHIQSGSHDCRGVCQSLGFEGEIHLWARAAQSNQSEKRSDTKDGQHFGAPGAPLKGPSIRKLCTQVRTGRFPSCSYVGWHLTIQVFYVDYTGKKHKTTWFGFDQGGGH